MNIEVVSKYNQVLNVLVKPENGRPWFLSVIYASPNPLYRRDLWFYLRLLGNIMTAPWVARGDFNQVLEASNKQCGQSINKTQTDYMREVVDTCNWLDLGFQGLKFTWTNGCKGTSNIKERIDQVWCNVNWHHMFVAANFKHLP